MTRPLRIRVCVVEYMDGDEIRAVVVGSDRADMYHHSYAPGTDDGGDKHRLEAAREWLDLPARCTPVAIRFVEMGYSPVGAGVVEVAA